MVLTGQILISSALSLLEISGGGEGGNNNEVEENNTNNNTPTPFLQSPIQPTTITTNASKDTR